MQKGIWVIGDVHGEYDKLILLLSKLPRDAVVCFTGDLIDRGEDSAKVIELIINSGYFCVLGNHELMMIKSDESKQDKEYWFHNGGLETLSSYAEFGDEVFKAHIEYFKTLPYFLYFEIEGHKPLVVSHSYIHHIWVNQEHIYSEDDAEDILWRHMNKSEYFDEEKEAKNGIFNIFGHMPVYNAVITNTYAMIDTGAVYENNKYLGTLSAIHYPSLKVIST
jgi:serine/threonine protein phosphatase 1